MPQFDHEKLDVYRVSLDFVTWVENTVEGLKGHHGYTVDQLRRASRSVSLNIAEGTGKRSPNDRRRFYEIARGSATESASTLDILVRTNGRTLQNVQPGKDLIYRIVCMLSKMTDTRTRENPES